jgi:RHS repeat-associated protein
MVVEEREKRRRQDGSSPRQRRVVGPRSKASSSSGSPPRPLRRQPGQDWAKTENVPNNLEYTGGHFDSPTGLYKLGIRYYDPTLGRFTQLDPTGQDPHYTYARNDPCNFIDPSGAGCVGNYLGLASGVVGHTVSAAAVFTGVGTALGVIGAGASLVGIATSASAIREDGCLD